MQSTLVLSKETGAILRTSGLLQSESSNANPNSALSASTDSEADNLANGGREAGIPSVEEVARMVWTFAQAAGTLADGLEKDDEVRLLRVRTRKHELVIVPGQLFLGMRKARWLTKTTDSKFILVVIHDTPPA